MAKNKRHYINNKHEKNMVDLIENMNNRHSTWSIFSDFLTIAACSLSNTCDLSKRAVREELYMNTIKKYDKQDLDSMCKMFGELVLALEEGGLDDILGDIFGHLDLGNNWTGQFFTPMHVCEATGEMLAGSITQQKVQQRGYISVCEPCSGSGALVIGFAKALLKRDINFQEYMLVSATDIDIRAVYMSYIQFSLLGIPSIVYHANSLTDEVFDVWYTPMYFLKGFAFRKQTEPIDFKNVLERMRKRKKSLLIS